MREVCCLFVVRQTAVGRRRLLRGAAWHGSEKAGWRGLLWRGRDRGNLTSGCPRAKHGERDHISFHRAPAPTDKAVFSAPIRMAPTSTYAPPGAPGAKHQFKEFYGNVSRNPRHAPRHRVAAVAYLYGSSAS